MNVRIQFDVPEEKVERLEELMKEAGIGTKKDLLNNALTLFEWAVKEKKANRIIASIDEINQKFKELIMPSLAFVSTDQPASVQAEPEASKEEAVTTAAAR